MKLHLFSEWSGYVLGLAAVITFALAVVAMASGFEGWALVAGIACLASLAVGLSVVGGALHHDHKQRRHEPRFPLPGGLAWPGRNEGVGR
ncbi:hypothetical protein ACFYVR_19325 [Rhodococcus sp. NPDC003318]|uniref:hypothetical protein n=1 Tax=Rhodococcus sp. NPDC003318 TaxID=3364503 RepID=UPI0036899D07